MIQHTGKKLVSELFTGENKVVYHIPKYQREYIWTLANWEALFDDIEESAGAHFLGSIICINTESDTSKPADLELVDGQQRMTTISLLYLAVYKTLKERIGEEKDEDRLVSMLQLKNRILVPKSAKLRLTPSYSNSNFEDYEWLASQILDEVKVAKKPKNLGNRRLSKAFLYFYTRLNEVNEEDELRYSTDAVDELLDKLNGSLVVKIDVATHSDAFTLFETLNNRGVPLTAIDIIKNKLLGHLEKTDKSASLDKNFQRWNQILANLTDDYNVQERFLRQFYNAFKLEKDIEIDKSPKALRSNLIHIYEKLIERNVHKAFDRLEDASEIYSKHIQYENAELPEDLVRSLRNLENVTGADGYMLLLFVVKRFEIDDAEKVKLVDLLCKYFIRRNITDTPPTRDLTNYFMVAMSQANGMRAYTYEGMREILLGAGKPASDDLFKEKLNGDLYEENVGATRYVLSSLELDATTTKEHYTNFFARNSKLPIWTVEHIFPQGENIPEHWVDMVANGDRREAEKIQADWCHKLGNLTLTGYNSQLSNESLANKQGMKTKEGKYTGFKNGLSLNESLKDTKTWTKAEIKQRTEELVEKALEVFKL